MSLLNNTLTRDQIITIVEQYVPVSKGFKAFDFRRYVQIAEENLIFSIFQESHYETFLQSTDPLLLRFQEQLKTAIINYAMADYSPLLNASISADGMTETNTPKSKTAGIETKRNAEAKFRDLYFSEFEKAISFAESSSLPIFDTWKASPNYTIFTEGLIKTAKEFSEAAGLNINRKIFLLLRSNLELAEYEVESSIGKPLFDALKTNNSVPYRWVLQKLVKPIIAETAMAKSIVRLSISISPEDTFNIFDNTGSELIKKGKTPSLQDLKGYAKDFEESAEDKQSELIAYLEENKTEFPEYVSPEPRMLLAPKDMGKITRM